MDLRGRPVPAAADPDPLAHRPARSALANVGCSTSRSRPTSCRRCTGASRPACHRVRPGVPLGDAQRGADRRTCSSRRSWSRSIGAALTPPPRLRPPLVCIHGFTGSARMWELVLPRLERHHAVLAPTLPGHAGGPPLDGPVSHTTWSTRSSGRWTRRGSRPRTSSATRSADTSRSSSRRAGGRVRWSRSRPPAGGRRRVQAGHVGLLQGHARAAAPRRPLRRVHRLHAGGPAAALRRSPSAPSTSRPSWS